MEDNQLQEFHATCGVYDVLSKDIRTKTQQEGDKQGYYGIGILTDEYCEDTLSTIPLKSVDERMEIALSIEGVDFVFPLDNPNNLEQRALTAFKEFIQSREEEEKIPNYEVGFVIGSFDMFHQGHLENIKLAKARCKRLYAVLKTDERILKNKNKMPQQNTAERAEILKSLKQVEDVLYMYIDTTRGDVLQEVMSASGVTDKSKIVAIFGSDLRQKEEEHVEEWEGIDIIFTYREPNRMNTVSSSNYQVLCIANGGLKRLEDIERSALENPSNTR